MEHNKIPLDSFAKNGQFMSDKKNPGKAHHGSIDDLNIDLEKLSPLHKDSTPNTPIHPDPIKRVYENLDEPWNMRIMILLKKIGEKAMGYRWMHSQEQTYFTSQGNKINVILIALLAITTTLGGTEFAAFVGDSSLKDNRTAMIIINCIIFALLVSISFLTGYDKWYDFKERARNHQKIAAKLNEINLDIQTQFSLPVSRREVDEDFLNNKTKEYNEIMEDCPTIRQCTMDKYIAATENSDIYKPIMIGGLEKIEIVIDSSGKESVDVVQDSRHPRDEDHSSLETKYKYQIERWLRNF